MTNYKIKEKHINESSTSNKACGKEATKSLNLNSSKWFRNFVVVCKILCLLLKLAPSSTQQNVSSIDVCFVIIVCWANPKFSYSFS